ncbi:hypothetical protein BLL52_3152 [Rhodoferax antarcticus ANT.BR]|uniref:Uncharacterized protein n=1 Tax=Rhodoferax antarcticus ANT.BR TaxID=1111071 RepID=A0A1Q8YBX3_9BURK|nr:hypothetical protein BLL52_3152 [Rhodoferax antarcticus ANT.BR]
MPNLKPCQHCQVDTQDTQADVGKPQTNILEDSGVIRPFGQPVLTQSAVTQ